MTKVLNLKPTTDLQPEVRMDQSKSALALLATCVGFRNKSFVPSPKRDPKPVIVTLPGHVRHRITGLQMKIIQAVTEHPFHMLVQLPDGSRHMYYNPE